MDYKQVRHTSHVRHGFLELPAAFTMMFYRNSVLQIKIEPMQAVAATNPSQTFVTSQVFI
ncbi:MAG: hypothetical protein AAF456_07515 [Planctomycetota bacterium]